MLTDSLRYSVEDWLSNNISPDQKISKIVPLSGGSINEAYCLITRTGKYFLKLNNAGRFPGMFESEMAGLKLLESTKTVIVPKIYHSQTLDDYCYILLGYEVQSQLSANYWESLAQQLSSLHKVTNPEFGLDHDNYIGSLYQSNKQSGDFYEFIIVSRLQPMLKMAIDNHLLNSTDKAWFELFFTRIHNLLPREAPSLLHGDLWSGNVISTSNGEPCLIDPAVYYGHRETDIAMTKLFGGFPTKFYDFYNSFFPLEKGWTERIELHQLYPLMVHVNLFGESYSFQVRRILKRFVA